MSDRVVVNPDKRREARKSQDELLLSILEPAEMKLVDICALVHAIDQKVYDDVLVHWMPNEEALPFSSLAEQVFLERGKRKGEYRVPSKIRQARFSKQRTDETARDVWNTRHSQLASHYESRGEPAAILEALYHRIAFDPVTAIARLQQLFAEADARFDLVRCGDLLGAVLAEEVSLLPNEVSLQLNSLRSRHLSRLRWADEYYRSASYLERELLKEEATVFLSNKPDIAEKNEKKWIRQVVAKGGMGKTAFVRWIVARYAVPLGIPCGKIDFDDIDRTDAAHAPEQILIQVAAQLDEQLGTRPFLGLLRSFAAQSNSASQRASIDVPRQMAAALRASKSPVVLLVLDTTEDALLYHRDALSRIIESIARIRDDDGYLGIRLLLSGRYNLREKLPGFEERFQEMTCDLGVPPFSPEEARRYLAERRNVSEKEFGKDILDAAIEKAEGMPFKLALLADLVTMSDEITAATIKSYPSADLLYLIERVIERLRNPLLRWVLRYGVVPQELDPSFVVEVLDPFIRRAISGEIDLDNREAGLETTRRSGVFPTISLQDDVPIDYAALWTELGTYASGSSWVEKGATPDTIKFHAEVREPMLELLAKQRVLTHLYKDTFVWYEHRAETFPQEWERFTKLSLQYRYKWEGAKILDVLDKIDATESRRAEVAAMLLETIRAELLDGEGYPLLDEEGKPRVDPAQLAQLYRILARSALDRGWNPKLGVLDEWREFDKPPWEKQIADWNEAQRFIKLRRQTAERTKIESKDHAEDAWFAGCLALFAKDVPNAIQWLENGLPSARENRIGIALELALGETYAIGRQKMAIDHFEKAIDIATVIKEPEERILRLRLRLARHLLAQDAPGDAETVLTQPPIRIETGIRSQGIKDLAFCVLAEALIEDGRPGEGRAPSKKAIILARKQFLLARAALTARNPRQVLADLSNVEYSNPEFSVRAAMQAESYELRGQAYAAFMQIGPAVDAFLNATKWWIEAGAPDAAARCRLRIAEVYVESGQFQLAQRYLTAGSSIINYSNETQVVDALLSAEISLSKNVDDAHRILDSLSAPDAPALPPRSRLRIALAKVSGPRPAAAWVEVRDALEDIPSVTTRLTLLAPLLRQTPHSRPPEDIAEALVKLVPPVVPRNFGRTDRLAATLTAAEFYVVIERKTTAMSLLDTAANLFHEVRNPPTYYPLVGMVRIACRIGVTPTWIDEMWEPFDREFLEQPLLRAMVRIQRAEIFFSTNSRKETLALLLDQAEAYLQGQTITRWHARLHFLRARIADSAGQKDEAQERRARASSILEEMALDTPYLDKKRLDETPRPQTFVLDPVLDDTDKDRSKRIALSPTESNEWARMRELFLGQGSPFSTEAAHRFVKSWPRSAEVMNDILEPLVAQALGNSDIQLEIADIHLHALPWECARSAARQEALSMSDSVRFMFRITKPARSLMHSEIEWIQRALSGLVASDGIYGPATTRALVQFQQKHGLPETGIANIATRWKLAEEQRKAPPSVVILEPSYERHIVSFSFTNDTESLYANRGFATHVIRDPNPEHLQAVLQKFNPSVLHITSALVPSRSGDGFLLDFNAEWNNELRGVDDVRSGLEPVELAKIIEVLPQGAPRPVVILDVPPQNSEEEMVQQIFMRNAFAAQLFDFQSVTAILATMLTPGFDGMMVEALSAGVSLGEICHEIRKFNNPPTLRNQLTSVATALFTYDPSMQVTSGAHR